MRRLSCLVALWLVAFLVVPAAAFAARTVVIKGGGWGHGIGMSQYGAYGRAEKGWKATRIVEHYYSKARVKRVAMPRRIRVGLLQHRSSISARSVSGDVLFKVAGERRALARGGPDVTWRVEPTGSGRMRLYRDGTLVKRDGESAFGDPAHPLVLKYAKFGSLVRVVDKATDYAYGRMEFGTFPTSSCGAGYCLRLVLVLSMQKYLYGLGEVPSSWPQAALRAQAIAGRTYAYEKVVRLGQHRYPCDCAVYDSTIDQAYIGDAKRTGSGSYWDDWTRAVDATKRKVILYRGTPIQALYSSSSGGHTEHNENVWGGAPIAYLRGVRDGADAVAANPNHTWEVQMSWSEFEAKLQSAYGMGTLERFKLVKPFGVSGRVTVVKPDGTGGVRIVGSRKTVRTSGWSIRSALGLKDTLFRVDVYDSTLAFGTAYARTGGETGPLGSPTSDVSSSDALRDGVTVQRFEGGTLYRAPHGDAVVALWGEIDDLYRRLGAAASRCGHPTADIVASDGTLRATFENGSMTWHPSLGIEIACT